MNRQAQTSPFGLALALASVLSLQAVLAQSSSPETTEPTLGTAAASQPQAFGSPPPVVPESAPAASNIVRDRLLSALATSGQPIGARAPLSTALIVLTAEPTDQALASLAEDLNVMCRIFDRALSQAGLRSDDIHFFIADHGREWLERLFANQPSWTECLYVQGYGPLFLMNVDFPLTPPPQPRTQPDPNEPRDPVWEQVFRNLYAPPGAHARPATHAGPTYNPEKVLALKTALVRALRHAVNIRGLAEDTDVTVMLRSKRAHGDNVAALFEYNMWVLQDGHPVRPVGEVGRSHSETSLLVIRATIRDIRAFASRDISFADFEKRIESTQY
ncbi:MAG: hypothetical protein ACYTAS_13565 [Planctomycetota bacterium]|jgi:hypothetical protein